MSKRLGKGLDALFPEAPRREEKTAEKRVEERPHEKPAQAKPSELSVSKPTQLSAEAWQEAEAEALSKPRLSIWSPNSRRILAYLNATVPKFNLSTEAAKLLEQSLRQKYPELSKRSE